jgi:hypothetical protein
MNFSLTCRPQIQSGQTCLQPDACTDGFWCNSIDGQSAGTCQPVAGPGETCDGTSATRNLGCVDFTTYCDSTTSVCEDRSEAGEACDDNVQCMLYAYCDAGTCRTRPLEGEACDAENGPPCLGDLECLESGVCGFEPTTDAPICEL